MTIRHWHSYIGLFVGPTVLFFALSGALQLFSLHEAHGSYRPPPLIERLSSVHKDQVFALGHHHEPAPDADPSKADGVTAAQAARQGEDRNGFSTLALKVFFLVVALCLVLSTSLGLWMGLTQTRRKSMAWTLLLGGALIPVGLLLL